VVTPVSAVLKQQTQGAGGVHRVKEQAGRAVHAPVPMALSALDPPIAIAFHVVTLARAQGS
jgi:hypothetical protein